METIKNFVQISDKIATAGQPTSDELRLVSERGYKHVVNLGMPDHPKSLPEEARLASDLGMSYHHIPVKFDKPRRDQVRLFCNLMVVLKKEKVFVHCIMNFRVSAFMYHYLSKVEKLSEVESKSAVFECWELEPAWNELMSWSSQDIGL